MSYILSAQRRPETVVSAFKKYRDYLVKHALDFPISALALASSEWYFNFQEHRCPHDGWLESITISEPATGEHFEKRVTTIQVRLFGAYHDGYIELFYPRVLSYSLNSLSSARGLGDWRYDEFRVSPSGHLIHEIEWAGSPHDKGARWIIEASDVKFNWIPK